jgi:hypothetical protein
VSPRYVTTRSGTAECILRWGDGVVCLHCLYRSTWGLAVGVFMPLSSIRCTFVSGVITLAAVRFTLGEGASTLGAAPSTLGGVKRGCWRKDGMEIGTSV